MLFISLPLLCSLAQMTICPMCTEWVLSVVSQLGARSLGMGWLPTANKLKVKCTLVQALRLCTGRTAHRGSRGIALNFHDHSTRRGEGPASRPGRSLPTERPGTHCTGGWVGPRASPDRCGKSRPQQDSLDRPACSQSLYRLSYRAHPNKLSVLLIRLFC
jgi:hypothetical protein